MLRLLVTPILLLTFSLVSFAQRPGTATISAGMLNGFCTTWLTEFANDSPKFSSNEALIESTRAWSYVSAIMDETSGAHWNVADEGKTPDVQRFYWTVSTKEVIQLYVKWFAEHPHGSEPANMAIKDAGSAAGVYKQGTVD